MGFRNNDHSKEHYVNQKYCGEQNKPGNVS